jgi:hypothetical protein
MQASKSRQHLVDFDTFECLSCHTVIRQGKPRLPSGGRGGPQTGRGADDR